MVSDSPETIKHPLEVLNTSDWAQKAGLEFARITTSPNGQTRSWTLSFVNGCAVRLSTAELNSPAKVSLKLQDAFLKPVLLPKSKDMWVAYWLSCIMEAAEEITQDSGVDAHIPEILSNDSYYESFPNSAAAASRFAEQKYLNTRVNERLLIGAFTPHKILVRTPILFDIYNDIYGSRPNEDDARGVLLRIGYRPGYPIKCYYTANEQQWRTSLFFWYKAIENGKAPTN